jgi:hypothetical protein
MFGWIRDRRERMLDGVSVCEECGQACDAACRAREHRAAERDRALRLATTPGALG